MDDDFDGDPFKDAVIEWARRWDVDDQTLAGICGTMAEELAFLAFVLQSTQPEDNVRWQQRQYAGAGAQELRAILVTEILG